MNAVKLVEAEAKIVALEQCNDKLVEQLTAATARAEAAEAALQATNAFSEPLPKNAACMR